MIEHARTNWIYRNRWYILTAWVILMLYLSGEYSPIEALKGGF